MNQPKPRSPESDSVAPEMVELDRQIQDALAELPPPAGLKAAILEGCRAQPPQRAKITWLWARRTALIAAAFALLFSVLFFGYIKHYNEQTATYAEFRQGMAHYAAGAYFKLDYRNTELEPIKHWLTDQQSPGFAQLPPDLLKQTPLGCKTLSWHDQPVTLVCFHREDKKIVHLFIIEDDGSDPAAFKDIEQVMVAQGLQTGGWKANGSIYLLAGSDPSVTVNEYLPTTEPPADQSAT